MLTGSLSQLGTKWILTCQIIDVAQGTIVQSKRIDGSDLYTMVDRLSTEIQQDYRLADQADIARKVSVREKTSASLEAYRHYLAGVDHLNALAFVDAVEALEKAIEIDPRFGQAYYKLAVAKWWESDVEGAGKKEIEFFLVNQLYVSEKEKRMAETMVELVRRDFAIAFPLAQALTRDYPDEKEAWYALGEAQFHFPGESKQFESAASFEKAMALDPDFQLPWDHIRSVMLRRGDAEKKRAKVETFLAKKPGDPFWNRERARASIYSGTLEETERAIEDALRFNTTPEDRRELYKALASTALTPGFTGEAIEYYRKALEADPEHIDEKVVTALANLFRFAYRYDEAEQVMTQYFADDAFEQARERVRLEIAEDKLQYKTCLKIARAQAAVRLGDVTALNEMFGEMERRDLSRADRRRVYRSLGWAWNSIGDYNRAKSNFEKAVATRPGEEDAQILSNLAGVERSRGRLDMADKLLRQGLAISPHHFGCLWSMTQLHLSTGELDTALVYAEKLADEFRFSYRSKLPVVAVRVARGELEKVDQFLDGISPRVPEDARFDMMNQIGWQYLKAGYPGKAEQLFRRASEMEKGTRTSWALYGLGWALLQQEDSPGAREAFERGMRIGDLDRRILQGLSSLHLLQGQLDEAERYARRISEFGAPSNTYHRLLAYVLAARGRHEVARAEAEHAVAMDSTRTSNEVLAWVLISGDLDIADGMAAAERAVLLPVIKRWDTSHDLKYRVSAEHSLGLAYLKQGNPKKSVEYLTVAASMHPNRKSVKRDLARARELVSQSP